MSTIIRSLKNIGRKKFRSFLVIIFLAFIIVILVVFTGIADFIRTEILSLKQSKCVLWNEKNLPGIEEKKNYIYVAMGSCNSVVAMDTSTNKVAAYTKIPGKFPHGIFYDKEKQRVYVVNEQSDDLDIIALPEFKHVKTISVGEFPPDVTVAFDKVYTADYKGNSVTIINSSTLDILKTIESKTATHFALAKNEKYIYVSNWKDDSVSVIDTKLDKIIKIIKVGKRPNHLTFSRDGKFVYVTNYKGNSVSVIEHDSGNVIKTIEVGKHPMSPIVNGNNVYVANIDSGSISVIDTINNIVINEITTGGNPQHMSIIAKENTLYVTNPTLENVQVIDLNKDKVIKEIFTGPSPQQIAPRYINKKEIK